MKISIVPLLLVFGLLARVHPADAQAPEPGPTCSMGGSFVTDTPPECNCTGETAEVTICHSSSVQVEVGDGKYVSASTGHSSSSCTSQDLEHGECLYYRYIFDCCYHWFWGWSCTLRETQAHSTTTDCDV